MPFQQFLIDTRELNLLKSLLVVARCVKCTEIFFYAWCRNSSNRDFGLP